MKYERELTDEEVAMLENDVMDAKEWIDAAIDGKLNKCAGRLAKQELALIFKEKPHEVDTSGLDKVTLAKCCLARPGHKRRKDRQNNGG